MTYRILRLTAVLLVVYASFNGRVAGEAVRRTPWGHPDLQGVWDFGTRTPFERPERFKNKAILTDEEAARLVAEFRERDTARENQKGSLSGGSYARVWSDSGVIVSKDRRTSLIVDPPDGKLPPLQPGVSIQISAADKDIPGVRPVRYGTGGIGADGPEDRGLSERCLLGASAGPPLQPSNINNKIQIFQTRDHVAILNEMIHDVRLIPLDGRPHIPNRVRQWMGDSRGRWEGNTLVVDTTNFTHKTPSFSPVWNRAIGTAESMHLTERFTRTDADTLQYEFIVEDSSTFTRPFAAAILMQTSAGLIYEYACHEGNYGMLHLLSAAREQDDK